MNRSAKKSSTHQHLTRPGVKKTGSRSTSAVAGTASLKVASGFGTLQVGTEVLPVAAAYKPIFRF